MAEAREGGNNTLQEKRDALPVTTVLARCQTWRCSRSTTAAETGWQPEGLFAPSKKPA